MKKVFGDAESYYSTRIGYSLSKITPVEYVLDPRWETIGWSVCIDDSFPIWLEGDEFRTFLQEEFIDKDEPFMFISHNALFDALILAMRYGILPAAMADTMTMARALLSHKLPRGSVSLKNVGAYFGMEKGNEVVRMDGLRLAEIKASGLYEAYKAYGLQDTNICREIFRALSPSFPVSEFVINDMVIRMAARPQFQIDEARLFTHQGMLQANKQEILARAGLSVKDLGSNESFAQALRNYGVEPPTKVSPTTGKTVFAFAKTDEAMTDLLEHDNLDVQALAAARLKIKSTIEETRTQRFLDVAMATRDEQGNCWMPIALNYGGAHTHRFSGAWKLNQQNLPSRDGNTALRESLKSAPGYTIVACDASQIEARLNAYLSGQWDLLEQFALGTDPYSQFATDIYGRMITKKDKTERLLGKICIGGGTLVYTDRGLIPIEQVTQGDKLWDGVEWINHEGLSKNGSQAVLKLCGVYMTPDHGVWCGGTSENWKQAGEVAQDESILSQALASGAESLSLLVSSWASDAVYRTSPFGVIVGVPNTRSVRGRFVSEPQRAAYAAAIKSHTTRAKIFGSMQTLSAMMHIAVDYSTACLRRLVGATSRLTQRMSIMGLGGLLYSMGGGGTAGHSSNTSKHSPVGMTRIWKWTAKILIKATCRATSALLPAAVTYRTNDESPISKNASENLKRKMPVYDLVNAGPRRRFMISTERGPLIVHNCILALGFGMGWMKLMDTVRVESTKVRTPIYLTPIEAQRIVNLYRSKYANINSTWGWLDRQIPRLANGSASGEMFGPFTFGDRCVWSPDGMPIHYENLRREEGRWKFDNRGIPVEFYGGKWLENMVQNLDRVHVMETALRVRDTLKAAKQDAYIAHQSQAIQLAHQVHDELIYVVPDELVNSFSRVVYDEMVKSPDWAPDLPLGAEVKVGHNYGDLHEIKL